MRRSRTARFKMSGIVTVGFGRLQKAVTRTSSSGSGFSNSPLHSGHASERGRKSYSDSHLRQRTKKVRLPLIALPRGFSDEFRDARVDDPMALVDPLESEGIIRRFPKFPVLALDLR